MSNYQSNTQQPPKTALDDPKLALHGEPWTEGDFKNKPSLKLRYVNNNFRFTCYLSHPDEGGDAKPVNVNMTLNIANTFLSLLEAALDDPEWRMAGVENKNYDWYNQKRSDKPSVQSAASVARDKDGVICIIITGKNRPTAVFQFLPSFWFAIKYKDGTDMSKSDVSKHVARGWLNSVRGLMGPVAADMYKHPEPKPRNAANDAGGRQNTAPPPAAVQTDVFM